MSPLCPGCGCLEWIITGPWPNATWLRVPIIRGVVSAAGRVPGVSRVTCHVAQCWVSPGQCLGDLDAGSHNTWHCRLQTQKTHVVPIVIVIMIGSLQPGLAWEQQRVIKSRSVYYRCCWHCTLYCIVYCTVLYYLCCWHCTSVTRGLWEHHQYRHQAAWSGLLQSYNR